MLSGKVRSSLARATARAAGQKGTNAPIQGELDLLPRTWGGRRAGAGRKRGPRRHDPIHRARPALCPRNPVHVVMRTRPEVGRLRKRPVYHAVRRVLERMAAREGVRVVHLSIQHNHLHLLAEAASTAALIRGMQALAILAAKTINRSLGRRGKVFAHRYHRTDITSPRQARSALAYVLNNWRKHREDQSCPTSRAAQLDPYSTALSFEGWRAGLPATPDGYPRLASAEPRTWLLRVGWRRHGPLDPREVPGRQP